MQGNSFSTKTVPTVRPLVSPLRLQAAVLCCFAVVLFWTAAVPRGLVSGRYLTAAKRFEGDEPSYLRMSHSLLTYGTLDLTAFLIDLHPFITREKLETIRARSGNRAGNLLYFGRNGGVYSLHMPGVSLLILASYAADASLTPADPNSTHPILFYLPQRFYFTFTLLLAMSLLNVLLVMRLLFRYFPDPRVGASLTILFILNSPFLGFSFKIYPESFGLLLTLLALNGILFPFRGAVANMAAVAAGIGLMPWFHQRFILIALGLGLLFVLEERSRSGGLRRIMALACVLVPMGLAYLGYFHHITGSFFPLSPSRLYGRTFVNFKTLPSGFLGFLFSRQHGIVWVYPWLVLFIFGVYRAFREAPMRAARILTVFIPYYLMASCAIQYQVTKPEGRYLLVLFPVAMIFCGYTLSYWFRNMSWRVTLFYLLFIALAVLNHYTWILNIGFYYKIRHLGDWAQVVKSAALVTVMILSLHLSERYFFRAGRRSG